MTRYEPYGLLNQLQREVNRLFNGDVLAPSEQEVAFAGDWVPPADVAEEAERFLIKMDVPGVNPAEIEITMENGVLSVKGSREAETKEAGEGYRRVERVRGAFLRRFALPDTAEPEKISAKTQNGVLEIVIPKGDKAKPRRISVSG